MTAAVTWPEAVAQLAGARTRAETCAALLKKYGDGAQIDRGQLIYSDAKADADAVIAGLITALSEGQEPASLSSLQARLQRSVSGLAELCDLAAKLLPATAGQKGFWADIVGIVKDATDLLKMLSNAVSVLYNNHRADDPLTREAIKTQLEAARWPEFSEVKAAQ